jgi:tagatose-1,6-bisphosphate aldolase non-catalytic subunit AgaZ/GatZ
MSRNVIDAAIALAYAHGESLMLIPSRRQIESSLLGGGYVENWDTSRFSDYVRSRDPAGLVLLCRDHGGPYQNPAEIRDGYSAGRAMKAAVDSLKQDIDAGFWLLHVDTSLDLGGAADKWIAMERAVSICGETFEYAASTGRVVRFEIGFETQGPEAGDAAEFRALIDETAYRLRKASIPIPTFVVAQTGTMIRETFNLGALKSRPHSVISKVRELVRAASRHGIAVKAHNCDYLDAQDLRCLMTAGVAAINIAPELGVAETRAFIELLEKAGLVRELDRFLELACASMSWTKWMMAGSNATDLDKAIIAGHYVYGTDAFRDIKNIAQKSTLMKSIDDYLRQRVMEVIEHYIAALKM